MAFMMPVVKNDWDIYNSSRSRRTSESAERAGVGGGGGGRVRKVSESRSEGPGSVAHSPAALSPHRSAPAMRSLAYSRPPASRASLRMPPSVGGGGGGHCKSSSGGPCSPTSASTSRQPHPEKFHNRARAESPPRRSRCGACMPYL